MSNLVKHYSILFCKKKKFLRFILITLLAVLFHRSAVIALLLYPIYHSKITKKWLLFAIPSLLAAFIYNKQLFLFFIRLLGSSYYEKYAEIQSTNAYTMIILFALFLAFSFFMVNDNDLDSNTLGLRNIMLLILAIQLFAPINTMAMRMNYYFLVYIPVLISNTILYSKEKLFLLVKTARLIMILFFVIYFFYNAYTGADILQVFPYKFYWE
ncbi:MAG TPA: EpsG family protein [Clostridiales bacterium]|nr:EpsG family protein [Clostridiales bacterium]